jgi:hypothetical protein
MPEQSGLPDISKANFYGMSSQDQQQLLDANEAALKALQQRYENPNWFNIAAGFFKPQLGGFAASLGSAAQAMGESIEKQRANELPVAQQRAQVALMKNQMAQNQAVNNLVANNKGPVTSALLQEAMKRAPDAPATKALLATYEASQKERQLASSELQNALERIKYADQRHLPRNPADEALVSAGSVTQPPGAGAPSPVVNAAPSAAPPSNAAKATIGNDERLFILQSELKKAQDKLAADPNNLEAQGDVANIPKEIATLTKNLKTGAPQAGAAPAAPAAPQQKYKPTVTMPDLTGMNPSDVDSARTVAMEQAKVLEKPHQEEVAALSYFNRPNLYNRAVGDTKAAMAIMDKYPDVAKKVFDVLRQGGQFAAAAQAGLGLHVMQYGASLSLPAQAWLEAGIKDEPVAPGGPTARSIADKLAQHLASSAYYNLIAKGVDPSTAGYEKMSLAMTQEPLMKNTAATAYTSLQQNLNDFKMAKELHDVYTDERTHNTHSSTLTPLHDIAVNSPKLKVIRRKYELANEAVNNNFLGNQPSQ